MTDRDTAAALARLYRVLSLPARRGGAVAG